MKILIKQTRSSEHLLIKLTQEDTIREVLSRINKRLYQEAIRMIAEEGDILKIVKEMELPGIEANLIITEEQAHFDLLTG